jgi:hypothetical protein
VLSSSTLQEFCITNNQVVFASVPKNALVLTGLANFRAVGYTDCDLKAVGMIV